MSRDKWLTETDRPSYQILKWIGGGGFGQVFKVKRNNQVVACKQIQFEGAGAALDEHEHMTHLRGGPHIAALHDGLEYNTRTKTVSFFMDYCKESQIINIGIQVAEALHYCHSKSILHQDMKPMNILLKNSWNPLTQRAVPELFVADFGIASHVQNAGTRFTSHRGTPDYEAPEIRGSGLAAFSTKSDIYAFGCVLYRLITLRDPMAIDDVTPLDIRTDYSIGLRSIVCSMLSSSRFDRPSAMDVMMQLISLIDRQECQLCGQVFASLNALRKHLKKTGHRRSAPLPHRSTQGDESMIHIGPSNSSRQWADEDNDGDKEPIIIIGPVIYGDWDEYGSKIEGKPRVVPEDTADENTDPNDPSPCVVCMRHFETKQRFYKHLHGAQHYRNPDFVLKRRAENEINVDATKRFRA